MSTGAGYSRRQGFTQRSYWYPDDLLAEMQRFYAVHGAGKEGGHIELCRRGLRYTDLATGRERVPAPVAVSGDRPVWIDSGQVRIRFNQFLRDTKPFSAYTNIHQFLTDAQLHYVMDRFPVMLWHAGLNGEHLHSNPALQYYTGCAAVDFMDGGWLKLIHPEDQERVVQTCTSHFQTRKPVRFPYRIWHYKGQYGSIIDYAEPRYRPDGSYAGFIGTMYLLDIPAVPGNIH